MMRNRLSAAGDLRCYIARGRSGESLLTVSFALERGLELRLATVEAEVSCRATNLPGPRTDPLSDLVRALRMFATGNPDVSCRWPADRGGCFLDLTRIDERRCGLALHSFAQPDWLTDETWLPRRGSLLFAAQVPVSNLVSAFILALEELRAREDFGEQWPWPFPQVELSRLTAAQQLP
ncbi:hypothetical protein [Amycolatopsis pigmentata]|uniref:Uncharacterized protein n=1 Tax=Amycolatopsis pigmentata TaxID=450801 RepID=A0ABW5G471_9PSEU